MALSFAQVPVVFSGSVSASGNVNATFGVAPTPGNLMVAICGAATGSGINTHSGWTTPSSATASESNVSIRAAYRIVQSGDGATQSPFGAVVTAQHDMVLFEITGFAGPINVAAFIQSVSNAAIVTGTISTSLISSSVWSGSLNLFGACINGSGATVLSSPAAYTPIYNFIGVSPNLWAGAQTGVGTSITESPSITWSSSGGRVVAVQVLVAPGAKFTQNLTATIRDQVLHVKHSIRDLQSAFIAVSDRFNFLRSYNKRTLSATLADSGVVKRVRGRMLVASTAFSAHFTTPLIKVILRASQTVTRVVKKHTTSKLPPAVVATTASAFKHTAILFRTFTARIADSATWTHAWVANFTAGLRTRAAWSYIPHWLNPHYFLTTIADRLFSRGISTDTSQSSTIITDRSNVANTIQE